MKNKIFFTNDFAAAIKKQKDSTLEKKEIIIDNNHSLNDSSSYSDQMDRQITPFYESANTSFPEQIITTALEDEEEGENIEGENHNQYSQTEEKLHSSLKLQQVIVTHPPSPIAHSVSVPNSSSLPKKGNNDLIYQEVQIVKKMLGFDEQDFRQKCHALNTELNKHIKDIIDKMYDALDRLVANLSAIMQKEQSLFYQNIDELLQDIRIKSIEADNVNRCLETFNTMIKQAYNHAFASITANEIRSVPK